MAKREKKEGEHCGGNGFGHGRDPETGEKFKVECVRCNGFGILLRDAPDQPWRKIQGIMELAAMEEA